MLLAAKRPLMVDALAKSRHTRERGYPFCCNLLKFLDSRFRGNDEKTMVVLFCQTIMVYPRIYR
jgi:hypothetical protein